MDAAPLALTGAPVRVGPIRAAGTGRVELAIDGHGVWFESDDAPLAPSPEAAAAAVLLPAALLDRSVDLADPVDPVFAAGMALLGRTTARWWDAPVARPRASPRSLTLDRVRARRRPRTALCFTGGVDSFHALAARRQEVDALLYVRGFESAEDDAVVDDVEAHVRGVADELALGVIVVRTNLRTAGIYRSTSWEPTHGGALAAVGHLLSGTVDRLLLGSSYALVADRPWGSHWRIDRRWGSTRLRVQHVDHELTRVQKVAAISTDPAARRHLLVCWQRRRTTANCGTCPKCVTTMAMLQHFGALDHFTTLRPGGDLARLVDELEPAALYAPSLRVVASGTSSVAAAARRRLEVAPPPPPPTPWPRRLADRLALP